MRLVSLFAGCGGMDIGFMKAGFEIVWANDFDPDAQRFTRIILARLIRETSVTSPQMKYQNAKL